MNVARVPPSATATPVTVGAKDFYLGVQQGDYAGLSVVLVRGYNPDLDAATEDLIPWAGAGGLYAFQAAAVAMELNGTAAADAVAGTGIRTVLVSGLNGADAEISETVTCPGVGSVALVNTYKRVNSLVAVTAGTGLVAAGTLTVRVTAGAVQQAQILPGESLSRHGVYTVPTGKTAYIASFFGSLRRSTSDTVDVQVLRRNPTTANAPTFQVLDFGLSGQGVSSQPLGSAMLPLVGPMDVWLRGSDATANNNRVSAMLTLILEG